MGPPDTVAELVKVGVPAVEPVPERVTPLGEPEGVTPLGVPEMVTENEAGEWVPLGDDVAVSEPVALPDEVEAGNDVVTDTVADEVAPETEADIVAVDGEPVGVAAEMDGENVTPERDPEGDGPDTDADAVTVADTALGDGDPVA
jgi:hypothetical protein